ncbi:MAG: exodeoxyribonuclease V subunit gamma [Clostridia bacterium]|nr:exodeoxyribonuclease V subunit gamma [Clostridia bacterium]
MLQFIFGKAASGKTYTVLEKIKELSSNKSEAVLIVPEQFTFESERAVLKTLGDRSAFYVSVLNFTRLWDEICNINGGNAGRVLGDADKIIFMHRALNTVANELKLWGRYVSNVSFSKTMLDTIGEFKINAIFPEDIRKLSENISSQSLKAKLLDIALIYEAYDILIGEKFIDPTDKLTKLYYRLENSDYFKGKTVFIDSFKGFTGQQFKIIQRILSKAKDVYITITDNPDVTNNFNIFTNIRKAVEKIEKMAVNYKVEIKKPIVLRENFYKNEDLVMLEKLLSNSQAISEKKLENITVCSGATVFDEAEFTARTIRKLVREENYRYRDFVIITRDMDKYSQAVTSALRKNNISYFYDNKIPLTSFPMTVAASSAIKALKFSTESILRFHKTGLGTLSTEEISTLENYTYLWNINGDVWLQEWKADIRGFVSNEKDSKEKTQEYIDALEDINKLRQRAIEPLLQFKEEFKGNSEKMAAAIVHLFENCKVSEKLTLMCDNIDYENEVFSRDSLKQAYEEYMNILDSLVNSFGQVNISASQFYDALEIAVTNANIGVIPQCLDQVTFGAADRIRPSRPKIAFILGANQGVFPKAVSTSGVFNTLERKNLIDNGINISDNSIYSSIDEEFLIYSNLCCPSERLYITYCNKTLKGEKCETSAFVDSVIKNLNCQFTSEPLERLTFDNLPETNQAALSEYCKRMGNENADCVSLSVALKDSEIYKKIDFVNKTLSLSEQSISPKAAKKLFGENIYMSATKFDNFNKCRFSYFCRYGLGAKRLQPADFDALQRGTIVHYVLERFINSYKKDIAKLDKNTISIKTDEFINEYLDSITGFRTLQNSRTDFIISRISRSLKDIVEGIALEFAQSKFEPVACELKIGKDGIPLEFDFEKGKIILNGSIDRVDEYKGYIRIIDYKTGSKSFKLPDILFGLNMQMLIYLYAVIRQRGISDDKAAGILYLPAKRDLNNSGRAMNGLLVAEDEVVSAMDADMSGEFVPKLLRTAKGGLNKRLSSYIENGDFSVIFDHIENIMKKTGIKILNGDIAVSPMDGRESKACEYCEYASVCKIENKEIKRVEDKSNSAVINQLREGE